MTEMTTRMIFIVIVCSDNIMSSNSKNCKTDNRMTEMKTSKIFIVIALLW